jgi:hypothetical protein
VPGEIFGRISTGSAGRLWLKRILPLENSGSHHRDDGSRHAGRPGKVPRGGHERLLEQPVRTNGLKAALERRKLQAEAQLTGQRRWSPGSGSRSSQTAGAREFRANI